MLMKNKMGIRRINLGKRYQAIGSVKSVLSGVQMRESSYS